MRLLGTSRPGAADVLTLGNATCGIAAVVAVSAPADVHGTGHDVLRLWAGLVLFGTVLDVLDGAAARRWGGTALGTPLDGMADAITFGLAPSIGLATSTLSGASGSTAVLVGAGVCAYAVGALLRLADFAAHRSGDAHFTGLPSPLAAIGVVDLALLAPPPLLAAAGLALLGMLMTSRLPYPANRGSALTLALVGWTLGLAGLSGLIDVRISAWATLTVIVLVLPAVTAVRRRTAIPADLPTC